MTTEKLSDQDTKTKLTELGCKLRELDSELCRIIVEVLEGSDADKWLDSAEDHIAQATHRISRAIKCLSMTATKS